MENFFCWDKDIAQVGADECAYLRNNYEKLKPATQTNSNKYEDLEKLKKLIDSGAINQEEFNYGRRFSVDPSGSRNERHELI